MTVSVDTSTEHVRTDTTTPQTFSHAGASSGVKGVVLAIIHNVSSTDHVSAASYGGTALTRIQRNADTTGEPGAAELWFLGASVPQGTQTVSYTPGATDDDFHAVCITLLGADNLEVVDNGGIDVDTANPSVTLSYGGRTCMAFAAHYSGNNNPANLLAGTDCTKVHDNDFGSQSSAVIRQTTAGSSDFAISTTVATSSCAFAAMAVSEVAASNWTLAVDVASFDIDGQTITLNKTWSTAVETASFDIDGSSLVLNQSAVLAQAEIAPAGQDITLAWTQNWTLAVDKADIQPVGQSQVLDLDIAVDFSALQPAGQDITLTWQQGTDTPITVDAAAFSVVGQTIDPFLTIAEQPSGGWVESAYQKRYASLTDEIRKELEEEQEREELADRLEKVLVQDGSLTQAQADLIRLRGIASQYKRDDLPNRARRSLAFAERAQSELALKLAMRELRKVQEEEELAVLLLMALD